MRRILVILLSIVIVAPVATANNGGDEAAIRSVIQAYAEGYNQRDRTSLERAFAAEHAYMKSFVRTAEGPDRVRVTAIPAWIDKIAKEGPPRDAKVKVLSVTIVNNHIANAFLDFDGSLYDMMLLAKIDGTWKIVNKVSIYQDPEPR